MGDRYSIRDLAREFDITSRTLRFYEEKGLLNPAREGQNRIYSRADRTRLRLILRGKRLGLTVHLAEGEALLSLQDEGAFRVSGRPMGEHRGHGSSLEALGERHVASVWGWGRKDGPRFNPNGMA